MTEQIETFSPPTDDVAFWIGRLPPALAGEAGGWRVRPLSGLTNRTLLLQGAAELLVLRLPRSDAGFLPSRADEISNMRLAARIGLAPELRFAEPESGLLVTSYLEKSTPLGAKDLSDDITRQQIADLYRDLRESGLAFAGRQDPGAAIDQYIAIHPDAEVVRLRHEMDAILAGLRSDRPRWAPQHVDPHPSNILRKADGALILIDWEFSALADPYWDVAAILNAMPEDDETAMAFARRALWPCAAFDVARLRAFQAALLLVAGSWAAMEAHARSDPALKLLARDFLIRCRAALRSIGRRAR